MNALFAPIGAICMLMLVPYHVSQKNWGAASFFFMIYLLNLTVLVRA